MSDLPITPEQALQLLELMEDTARELEDAGSRSLWLSQAKELRRYIEVSIKIYEQNQELKKLLKKHKPN
jgi:flagellar basal body-associated protein FliL